MILPNAKRVIFLNAGHSLSEPGAVRDGILESGETKKIRDACLPLLRAAGFEVHSVPAITQIIIIGIQVLRHL